MLGAERKLAGNGLVAYKGDLKPVGAHLETVDVKLSGGIGDGAFDEFACRILYGDVYELQHLVGLLVNHFSTNRALSSCCQHTDSS